MDIIRESAFGQLANYFSKGRAFPYQDHSSPSTSFDSAFSPEPIDGKEGQKIRSLVDATKLVGWTGPDDPDMPCNWPAMMKFVATTDIMILNFSFYLAAAVFTPSIPRLEEAFGATTAEGTLGLSLFVIAYGLGPLVVRFYLLLSLSLVRLVDQPPQLSPFSNVPSIGRTPVYLLGLLSFCVLQIGIANAKNIQTVLVLRFLAGFVGSAPISVGGASLSEIYRPTQRAYAISLYTVSGVASPILGPVCFISASRDKQIVTMLTLLSSMYNRYWAHW
jgi:DHA1 family multidrug resistance protein-like MFS transporter